MTAHSPKAKLEGPAGCLVAVIALAFIGASSIALGAVSITLALLERLA